MCKDIIDAVCTEADSHARKAVHAKDSGEVVVTSAAGYAAYCYVLGFDFDDCSGVIV